MSIGICLVSGLGTGGTALAEIMRICMNLVEHKSYILNDPESLIPYVFLGLLITGLSGELTRMTGDGGPDDNVDRQ